MDSLDVRLLSVQNEEIFHTETKQKAIYDPTYLKNIQILIKMSSSGMTKIHVMV